LRRLGVEERRLDVDHGDLLTRRGQLSTVGPIFPRLEGPIADSWPISPSFRAETPESDAWTPFPDA